MSRASLLDSTGLDVIAFSVGQAAEKKSPIMVQEEHPVLPVSILINK